MHCQSIVVVLSTIEVEIGGQASSWISLVISIVVEAIPALHVEATAHPVKTIKAIIPSVVCWWRQKCEDAKLLLGCYHLSILEIRFAHLHVESKLSKLQVSWRYQSRWHLAWSVVHDVAAMIHLLLFVCTVAVMIKNSSAEVLVRICSLLFIFLIVGRVMWARVLRDDRQLEFLVTSHTVVHVSIIHRVTVTKLGRRWELVVVVDQIGANRLAGESALLLHLLHVACLLPSVLLLLGLVRPSRCLSDHRVSGYLFNRLFTILEQLLGNIALLRYFLKLACRNNLLGIWAAKVISLGKRRLEFFILNLTRCFDLRPFLEHGATLLNGLILWIKPMAARTARHWFVGLLSILWRFDSGRLLDILATSFVVECIIDGSATSPTLPCLPWSVAFLLIEAVVLIDVNRLQLVDHIIARGRLVWNKVIFIRGHNRETLLSLFLECFGLFQVEVWDWIFIFQIWHDVMVFQIVQIKSVQKISESLLPFFEFVEEFLGVRPGLSGCSSTDMFLNLFPLLAMNFKSFEEPKMLILGPSTSLMSQSCVKLHEWRKSLLENCGLFLKRDSPQVLS